MAEARLFHWEYQAPPVPRETICIEGGRPLRGEVSISGSKNAALKLLAAATLTGERCRFTNVPEIADVVLMVDLLRDLGVVVDHPEPGTYEVSAGDVDWLFVPLEAAAKMRASFILLGPLLARFGRVIISNPGGDRIGRRPVDLHVEAMQALGASVGYRNGYYFAQAPGRLRGGHVRFPHVTVMGTENAMLAATLADGHTTIRPAAQEPEVDDLIDFLQAMGAEVQRTDPDVVEVEGRRRLRGATHHVIADRIEAGTFAVAAAITGGDVTLRGAPSAAPGRLPRRPAAHRRGGRRRRGPHHRPRRRPRPRGLPRHGHRDGALPGPRHGPPAADLGAPDTGRRAQHGPRDDLRGPPRVARPTWATWVPTWRSATPTTPSSRVPRACAAATS